MMRTLAALVSPSLGNSPMPIIHTLRGSLLAEVLKSRYKSFKFGSHFEAMKKTATANPIKRLNASVQIASLIA